WRTLSKWRTDQHGFCRVGRESGCKQADGQETADAMESAGSSSPIAGSNPSAEWGVGGNLPCLVSRLPATSAECCCLTPRNLTLSCFVSFPLNTIPFLKPLPIFPRIPDVEIGPQKGY